MAGNKYRIGIDVGGTFTEVVRLNTETRELDSAQGDVIVPLDEEKLRESLRNFI